jgi:hypothetical protein
MNFWLLKRGDFKRIMIRIAREDFFNTSQVQFTYLSNEVATTLQGGVKSLSFRRGI